MNQVLFYSLSFSVLIYLSAADEYSELDCAPANCGNVRNITFPFWVENKQSSYCGFPSSRLTCENGSLFLAKIGLTAYSAIPSLQVKNIFHGNRSVLVVDETLNGLTCGFTHWSLSFNLTLFSISGANKKLVFIYDCTKPPSDDYYKINCSSGVDTTYAVWDTDLRYPDTCSRANIPVAGYMADNIRDYLRAVNYGFLLDWPETDCEVCKKWHGKCGYNESYAGFMCICPDGTTHHAACRPEKKRRWAAVIEVVAGVGGVFLLGMCVVLFLCVRRKRNLLSSKMDPETEEIYYNMHIFSYDELEEATNGFHESRKLGNGGFGTVYKGLGYKYKPLNRSNTLDEHWSDPDRQKLSNLNSITATHAVNCW